MAETTGTVDYKVGSETFQTWYKVVGDLKSGVRPVVTLHGGPGISHHYMLPHVELNTAHNIPVVFYDQIGIGASSHVKDKPAEFWTVELFMDELDNLLDHLGISDSFDLLGHSWGGMFAAHYASHRTPKGLKRLIIASSPCSMKLWEEGTHALLETLPDDVKATVKKHEAAGTTSDKEYQDAMQAFYSKYVCAMNPWPPLLLQSFGAMHEDLTVYSTMLGPSEFNITGTLKTWDIVSELSKINVPTLLINGPKDEAQDVCVLPFFLKIPKVKWVQFNIATHIAHFEEKERYFSVVSDFLATA